jgi:hypothetical protein
MQRRFYSKLHRDESRHEELHIKDEKRKRTRRYQNDQVGDL